MASKFLYRYVFKRTSTFVLGVVVCSMIFERAFDEVTEDIFQWINRGKLWPHIKDRYGNKPEEVHYQQKSLTKRRTSEEISQQVMRKKMAERRRLENSQN